jgi:hypothetical protein
MTTLYQNAHSSERVLVNVLKYLDIVAVVIVAIPALLLGAPAVGYIVGGAAWLAQRALQLVDQRMTAKVDDSLRRAGVSLFEALGRILLLAAAIIVAGLAGGHKDGLTAALVIIVAYSVAFVIRLMSGPPPERRFS